MTVDYKRHSRTIVRITLVLGALLVLRWALSPAEAAPGIRCNAHNIGAKFIEQGAPPFASFPGFIGLLIFAPFVMALEDAGHTGTGLYKCHLLVFGKAVAGSKALPRNREPAAAQRWYHPAGNTAVSVNWVTG